MGRGIKSVDAELKADSETSSMSYEPEVLPLYFLFLFNTLLALANKTGSVLFFLKTTLCEISLRPVHTARKTRGFWCEIRVFSAQRNLHVFCTENAWN